MRYWVRWHGARGEEGPRMGPFAHRKDAERHLQTTLRQWANDLEHVAGKAGVWTANGELWSDEMFHDQAPLGRFIIEEDPDDAGEGAH